MYRYLLLALVLFLPAMADAHEVYVLPPDVVAGAMSSDSPNPLLAFFGNEYRFFFSGVVAAIVFLTILFASIFRAVEVRTVSISSHLKRVAHPIVRITAGACLIVYGAYSSFFGPEIPFSDVLGSSSAWTYAFIALGGAIVLGFQTRIAALLALGFYVYGLIAYGEYMLLYVHHAGAYLLLIIIGGGPATVDHKFGLGWTMRKRLERASSVAFPMLRIALGASIVAAAIFAKFMHSNLALEVVTRFGMQQYFPFDPLFVVLGALIVELLAGLMLIVGIEIRWTALFLVTWLTLGHLYFEEGWWVHLPLYGYGLAILCHGYDRYTILGKFFKHRAMEPML